MRILAPIFRKKYFYVIVLVLVSIIFVAKGTAYADKQVLTVTPTSSTQVVDPGSVKTGEFQVVNQGENSYSFKIYAAAYSVNSEDYDPDFTPLPGKPDVASWIQFSIREGTIEPGQSANVSYRISVPKDALPGGYYAVAFAQTQQPKLKEGINLIQRVGEIFYLQVAGPSTEKGNLASWKSGFLQKSPLVAVARLSNEGSVHYTSDINLQVRDIFGHPKYTLKTQKVILPQTTRKITTTWDHAPSIGLFKVNGTVTILGQNKNLPTKYVLVLSPTVRIILLVVFILLIILVGLRYVIRYVRRPKKEPRFKKIKARRK